MMLPHERFCHTQRAHLFSMLWIWTTLLAGAKTVAAQQTIQSISGEFQWICPDSRTPETVLANSCGCLLSASFAGVPIVHY